MDVLPRYVPRSCRTGTPELESCIMSSPISLPRDATELKMTPTSLNARPDAAATFATDFSVLVISSPDLMPAAESVAAAVAASPRPNAVPRTDCVAESIMDSMSWASWPKPASFFRALSMFSARSMPPWMAIPATAAIPAWPTPISELVICWVLVRTAFHALVSPFLALVAMPLKMF